MSTSHAATIAKQRTILREADLTLMSVAYDVADDEAAIHLGRARASIRAAQLSLAAAARRNLGPAGGDPAAIVADVAAQASRAKLIGDMAREAFGS